MLNAPAQRVHVAVPTLLLIQTTITHTPRIFLIGRISTIASSRTRSASYLSYASTEREIGILPSAWEPLKILPFK